MFVTGNVKTVMLDRGFFFVRIANLGDIWCHSRDLRDGLEFDHTLEQRHVELEVEQLPRGPRGRNIRAVR